MGAPAPPYAEGVWGGSFPPELAGPPLTYTPDARRHWSPRAPGSAVTRKMVGLDSGALTGRRDECPGLICHWTSCAIIARVPRSRPTSTYGGGGAWTRPAPRPARRC